MKTLFSFCLQPVLGSCTTLNIAEPLLWYLTLYLTVPGATFNHHKLLKRFSQQRSLYSGKLYYHSHHLFFTSPTVSCSWRKKKKIHPEFLACVYFRKCCIFLWCEEERAPLCTYFLIFPFCSIYHLFKALQSLELWGRYIKMHQNQRISWIPRDLSVKSKKPHIAVFFHFTGMCPGLSINSFTARTLKEIKLGPGHWTTVSQLVQNLFTLIWPDWSPRLVFPLNHWARPSLEPLFACTLPLRSCQSFTAHGNLGNLHELTGLDFCWATIAASVAAAQM